MATFPPKQHKGMPGSKFVPVGEKAKPAAAAKQDFPKGKKGGMVSPRKSK